MQDYFLRGCSGGAGQGILGNVQTEVEVGAKQVSVSIEENNMHLESSSLSRIGEKKKNSHEKAKNNSS